MSPLEISSRRAAHTTERLWNMNQPWPVGIKENEQKGRAGERQSTFQLKGLSLSLCLSLALCLSISLALGLPRLGGGSSTPGLAGRLSPVSSGPRVLARYRTQLSTGYRSLVGVPPREPSTEAASGSLGGAGLCVC